MTARAPLGDDEFADLLSLLRRFAETELDQFDNWRFDTCHGPVFVVITREPGDGVAVDAYRDVTPRLPR